MRNFSSVDVEWNVLVNVIPSLSVNLQSHISAKHHQKPGTRLNSCWSRNECFWLTPWFPFDCLIEIFQCMWCCYGRSSGSLCAESWWVGEGVPLLRACLTNMGAILDLPLRNTPSALEGFPCGREGGRWGAGAGLIFCRLSLFVDL